MQNIGGTMNITKMLRSMLFGKNTYTPRVRPITETFSLVWEGQSEFPSFTGAYEDALFQAKCAAIDLENKVSSSISIRGKCGSAYQVHSAAPQFRLQYGAKFVDDAGDMWEYDPHQFVGIGVTVYCHDDFHQRVEIYDGSQRYGLVPVRRCDSYDPMSPTVNKPHLAA